MRMFGRGDRGWAAGQVLLLVANGHQVTAMTRRVGRTMDLYAAGAEPAVADALDRDAVLAAVTAASGPDAVVQIQPSTWPASPTSGSTRVRRHQPPAHRGHRPPAGGGAGRRGQPACAVQSRRVAVRPGRRAGQDRGRPARP